MKQMNSITILIIISLGSSLNPFYAHAVDSQEIDSAKTLTLNLADTLIIDDYLVPTNVCDSTSDSHRALRGRGKDKSISARQAEYNKIKAAEKQIDNLHFRLKADEYSSQGFYEHIATPLDSGSQSLDDNYLMEWEKRNSEFQKQRLALTAEKQNYVVNLIQDSLHQEVEKYVAKKGSLEIKQSSKLSHIDEVFKKWETVSHVIGEDVNPQQQSARMYALAEYLEKVRDLMADLGKADSLPWTLNHSKISLIKSGIAVAGSAISTFFTELLAKNYIPLIDRIKYKNNTPFTHKISSVFKKVSEIQGYRLKVEGEENLENISLNGPANSNKKTINFFLPAHRHDIVDAMAMTQLGLPHFMLFANAAVIMPTKSLAKMVASRPDFIGVGKITGFTPISAPDKAVQSANEGVTTNAINYPQGLVSNAGEILPINPSFTEKLLKRFIDEGYEVNIVPVVYETDSRALSHSGGVDDKNITVKILPPLLHNTVKAIVEKELQDQAAGSHALYINHFLNSAWYDNLQKHKELTVDQLLDRAEGNLGLTLDTTGSAAASERAP